MVGFPFPNLFTDLFQTSGSVGLVPPWVRHVASAVHKAVKPPPDTWKRKTSKNLMDDWMVDDMMIFYMTRVEVIQ